MKGDRLRLAQILNNLLSNALKFTDKGRIHLQVRSVKHGQQLQFSVKDTGIGMSAEQCAELFKPFSQVDDSSSRRYGGAGLGLSICKNLVELMGGTIWVESVVGAGTTFHFTVDCIEPEFQVRQEDQQALKLLSQPAAIQQSGPETPPMLNRHVLVVDDHKLNRMVASEMLKKMGCTRNLGRKWQRSGTSLPCREVRHRVDGSSNAGNGRLRSHSANPEPAGSSSAPDCRGHRVGQ